MKVWRPVRWDYPHLTRDSQLHLTRRDVPLGIRTRYAAHGQGGAWSHGMRLSRQELAMDPECLIHFEKLIPRDVMGAIAGERQADHAVNNVEPTRA